MFKYITDQQQHNTRYYPECITHHSTISSYVSVIQHRSNFQGQSNCQDVSEKCGTYYNTSSKEAEVATHLYIRRHSTHTSGKLLQQTKYFGTQVSVQVNAFAGTVRKAPPIFLHYDAT